MNQFSSAREVFAGIHRRSFLTAAASAVASSSRSNATTFDRPHRNVIKVILQGGPSQIDLWDPKPTADTYTRGPFKLIQTRIPGINVSECLPQIADNICDFTIVRSVTGAIGSHNLIQATTGQSTTRISSPSQQPVLATSFSSAQTILEAGNSNIALKFGHWDHHRNLRAAAKLQARTLDSELTTFIRSLKNSALLESTIVLVWGEFGRSPQMNNAGGRDHWPAVNSALIAGGPFSRGNVWGATSEDGSHVVDAAISMSEVVDSCFLGASLSS